VTGRIVATVALAAAVASAGLACAGDDAGRERAAAKNADDQVLAGSQQPACPSEWERGWQKLADRIKSDVYCPSWLPAPLTGELRGEWHSTDSVRRDGSYLMGFIWFERESGEVHVNFRGYPGRTGVPNCNGKPCFSDSQGQRKVAGFDVTVYTVNRGADTWHILYAWEHEGSLYTVSQHVVPHLEQSYEQVTKNLDRIMAGLQAVEPRAA
jgi:hypothetical protein